MNIYHLYCRFCRKQHFNVFLSNTSGCADIFHTLSEHLSHFQRSAVCREGFSKDNNKDNVLNFQRRAGSTTKKNKPIVNKKN